jgi:four helix bundle protein
MGIQIRAFRTHYIRTAMNSEEFKNRTKAYGLRLIRLVESLPKTKAIAAQLVRCGISVGANYRAACRARSRADFAAKMGVVEEECDESLYWMELLIEAGLVKANLLASLRNEGSEILSIVVSSIRTARSRKFPNPHSEIRIPK